MPARAGMRGPLVYLHQIQKCTWPEGLPSNCAREAGAPSAPLSEF